MARMEMSEGAFCNVPVGADAFFALGMMHASGRDTEVDLVAAHRWFNIAAARGHHEAARLRREIAEQMSDAEIGLAQRSARDWLRTHPLPAAPALALRTAA